MCVIFLVYLECFNIVIRASVDNSNFFYIITEEITLFSNKSIFFFQGTREIDSLYWGFIISRFCSIHFERPGWRISFVIP